MLNETFSLCSSLSKTEENTLYYMSSYVAFKGNIAVVELINITKDFPCSEFTNFLSLGKLSHQLPESF